MRNAIGIRLRTLAVVIAVSAVLGGCYTTRVFEGASEAPQQLNDRWLAIVDLRKLVESDSGQFTSWGYIGYEEGAPRRCHYNASQNLNVETHGFVDIFIPLDLSHKVLVNCENGQQKTFAFRADTFDQSLEARAVSFARTWKSLGSAYFDDNAERNFAMLAQSYRAQNPPPAYAEEVRPYRVAAEVAVREKRLTDAIGQFRQGLNRVPTWPQGHYNIALLYAEVGVLEGAIDEMQKYLQLVPNAANARQAQDKIYEWKSKTQ